MPTTAEDVLTARRQALREAEAAVVAVRDARMALSETLATSTYSQLDKAVQAIRELAEDQAMADRPRPQPRLPDPGMPERGACWVDWLVVGMGLAAFMVLLIATIS